MGDLEVRSHVVRAVFDFSITFSEEAGKHIGLFRGQMFPFVSFQVLRSFEGVLAMRTFVASNGSASVGTCVYWI